MQLVLKIPGFGAFLVQVPFCRRPAEGALILDFICFSCFYPGDSPDSPDDLAHHHRRGRALGPRGQGHGTRDGKRATSGPRRPGGRNHAGLHRSGRQEEEETEEEAQSGAAQGRADDGRGRGGGAVRAQLRRGEGSQPVVSLGPGLGLCPQS